MNCPSCGAGFTVETSNGVSVAMCGKCDGTWLAPGDLDRLTGQALEQQLDAWMSEPTECRYCETPLGFGAECVRCHKPPTLQCPRGHGVMNATLIELGLREFEIDQCPSCRGIWVDGHERSHLDAVDPPPVRKLAVVQPPAGLDRVGQGGRGSSSLPTSFLGAVADELTYGTWHEPGGSMWAWRPGRREPLEIIFLAIVIGAAIALLYFFSGGSLVAF